MLEIERQELLIQLGNRIKTIRQSKGITQVQLSFDCDMEKASLSRIEAGKVNVSYMILHRISIGLVVTMLELVVD